MNASNFDLIALFDDDDEVAQMRLRTALENDPELVGALTAWRAFRATLGENFSRQIPPARILVLASLAEADPALLSSSEAALLEEARPSLDAVRREHPSLDLILKQIQRDAASFDADWEGVVSDLSVSKPIRLPVDRAPARSIPFRRVAWRASAGIAVVLFVAAMVMLFVRDAGFETHQAGGGQALAIALWDGSEVVLEPGAAVEVPRAGRSVRAARVLNGRAFFDIAYAAEPFVVSTANAEVTVLGTSFTVSAHSFDTEVALFSGRVEVGSRITGDASAILQPGERTRVRGDAAPDVARALDSADDLAWTGRLIARSERVDSLAERLARHYSAQIRIADALSAEEVTGTFTLDRPLSETLHTLARTLDARVEQGAGGVFEIVR